MRQASELAPFLPEAFTVDCFDHVLSARMNKVEFEKMMVLRGHPNFLNAHRTYNALLPSFYANNVMLNKVVTEAWRFEMLVYSLYLHDTRRADDPRSGLTVANLERVCREMNCASPGRVRAVLGIMSIGGFLRRSRSQDDSRVIQLEPTPHFVRIVEGWNNRILQVSDSVFPHENLAKAHTRHPRFGCEMRSRGAIGMMNGFKVLEPFPEVDHFVSSDGGWMLLLHCVAEALRLGQSTHIMPVSLDLAAFGAKFGVSRSHLRRLLESAFAAGLLRAPPRNGSYILLAKETVASFLCCMAYEVGFLRGHALAGQAFLGMNAENSLQQDGLGGTTVRMFQPRQA